MHNNSNNKKNHFSSKKIKYGATAIMFTVIFIAAVLVLNIALTFVGYERSLYVDLTREEFYTVSDASIEQLKDIKEPVEIVFFQKKEDIGEPSGSNLFGYVRYLAEEYAKSFGFISVKYVDMPSSPALANSYKSSTNDTIKTTSVVISCPGTGKKKIVQDRGFFTFKEDGGIYGFNGEKRITSCILQVSDTAKRKAFFTNGHEEYLSGTLATLLADEGYEVDVIDLSTQDIPENTDLIVINQPAKDFAGAKAKGAGGTNEIEKIKNYIQKDFGNVILTLSAGASDLPELRELMEENFGVSYLPESVIADTTANSVDVNGLWLVAKTGGADNTYEYQMHKAITEKNIKIIAPQGIPLVITGKSDKYVAPVFVSSKDSRMQTASDDTPVAAPETPLAVISSRIAYDENQNEKRGNLLVIGSLMLEMTTEEYSAYGNRDFFYGILKSFGNSSVALDISPKPFEDTSLVITSKQANTSTIVISLVIPVILLVFGTVIWVRRKCR